MQEVTPDIPPASSSPGGCSAGMVSQPGSLSDLYR